MTGKFEMFLHFSAVSLVLASFQINEYMQRRQHTRLHLGPTGWRTMPVHRLWGTEAEQQVKEIHQLMPSVWGF